MNYLIIASLALSALCFLLDTFHARINVNLDAGGKLFFVLAVMFHLMNKGGF